MNRLTVVTALSTAGLVAAVSAASAPATSVGPKKIGLTARSKLQHAALIEAPPSGRSAGDRFVFTEALLDAKGRTIGHDAADCVALFDQRSQCTGSYTLKGGTVMVQLLQPKLSGNVDYRQAVVGGTGKFTGAGGTVAVKQRAAGDHFAFHLTVPR